MWLKFNKAYLCPDCEIVSDYMLEGSGYVCPLCGSKDLLNLKRVIDLKPKEEKDEVQVALAEREKEIARLTKLCADSIDNGDAIMKELSTAIYKVVEQDTQIAALRVDLSYEQKRADKGWKLHQECHDVMERKIIALKAENEGMQSMLEKTDCYHCKGWKEADHD